MLAYVLKNIPVFYFSHTKINNKPIENDLHFSNSTLSLTNIQHNVPNGFDAIFETICMDGM